MNYWIIAANGQTYGPADLATLRRWVAESRVVGTTPVGESETGPFRDAALVPELATAFGAPPVDAADAQPARSPGSAPPTSPQAPSAMPADWPPQALAVSQLVSGIFNLIVAAGWVFTCFGIILSIPLAFLGVYELIAYSKARTTDPRTYLESTKTKAILDICSILAGNVGSAVCGIVMLTQIPAARERAGVR